MRKVLLLFIVFFITNSLNAQYTFEKVIDTLGNQGASCIQETYDGGYVFCGSSSFNGNDATIVKLDSTGYIEWAKVYSGPGIEAGLFIEQTIDSGYIVNGVFNSGLDGQTWLLRLDQYGDTLWTKTFVVGAGATQSDNGNSMASINNTIYGATGYYKPIPFTTLSASFIAIDGSGTMITNKKYNANGFSCESRSINKTNNGFIMAGTTGTSSSTSDVYVIRTDELGDTIWTKTYDNSQIDAAMAVEQTSDSGFIIAGYTYNTIAYNIYLIRTDSIGDTIWTKSYYSAVEQNANSIQETRDLGFIICGTAQNPVSSTADIYLVKTNNNGDTLWSKSFGSNASDNGYFVKQTKDGGYLICGEGKVNGVYGSYIIKTDSLGNVSSSTGLAEINNPFEFSIYPNPSNGFFNIHVNGISKNSIIEIYNIISQQIYSCKIQNNNSIQVNLNNQPTGLYQVILKTNKNNYFRKIIVE